MSRGPENNQALHPPGRFPTTDWTALDDRDGGEEKRRDLVAELIRRYEEPLRAYCRRAFQISETEIEELIQGFLVDKIVLRRLIDVADRQRGRFRSLLVRSLRNYFLNQVRDDRLSRARPLEDVVRSGTTNLSSRSMSPTVAFDVEWAREVLRETLDRMEQVCCQTGRMHEWGVFNERVVEPTLFGAVAPGNPELQVKFGLSSPREVTSLRTNAKRRFVRILHEVISEYLPDSELIENEIRDLRRTLSKACVE